MEKFNSFDRTVEMFKEAGADAIFLDHYNDGMVSGSPYNSKTGQIWYGFSMISSLEEALKSQYPKATAEDDEPLNAAIQALKDPSNN